MDDRDQAMLRQLAEDLDKCRICHRSISSQDLKVLDKESDTWLVKYDCPDCRQFSWFSVGITIHVEIDQEDRLIGD